MKTYIIMKQRSSAIARYEATPHLVVSSLKEAREKCADLEKKAATNFYWYESVKNTL